MALPRNRPVPIAPARAIMESCRGVRFRCSPASRSRIALSALSFVKAMLAARESAMAGHRIRKQAPDNSAAPERPDSVSRSTTGLRRPFGRERLFLQSQTWRETQTRPPGGSHEGGPPAHYYLRRPVFFRSPRRLPNQHPAAPTTPPPPPP